MQYCSIILLLIVSVNVLIAQNNMGIGTTNPNTSAALDITAIDKGILIPRVFLDSINDISTIPSPAKSLMIYNSNPGISGGNGEGFYYWDSTQWIQAMASQGPAGAKGSTGTKGAAGSTGVTGSTGPVGLPGTSGARGTTGPSGSLGKPVFFSSPILVANPTGAMTWTTYSAVSVPLGSSAVMLQVCGRNDQGDIFVRYRQTSSTTYNYLIYRNRSAGGGDDTGNCSRAVMPIDPSSSFQYMVELQTNAKVDQMSISLIGYWP